MRSKDRMDRYVKSIDEGQAAKQQYDKYVEEFKFFLKDKTAPKNQTAAYTKNLHSTLLRLMDAANELDGHNPGQGVFGLIVLALRASIAVKDQNVELEVRIRELEREIQRLKKR